MQIIFRDVYLLYQSAILFYRSLRLPVQHRILHCGPAPRVVVPLYFSRHPLMSFVAQIASTAACRSLTL